MSDKNAFLDGLQRAIESLYRLHTGVAASDYVIDERARDLLHVQRAPREQLLLVQNDGALEIGLFVDESVLDRVRAGVHDDNLPDFVLAVEGVSHFVYAVVRAREERPFSGLELELQAEVDKYLLALVATWEPHRAPPAGLRERLFENVRYEPGLSDEEHDRYVAANDAAEAYVASLEERYVRRRAVGEMLAELRRFHRLSCSAKLDHIKKAA